MYSGSHQDIIKQINEFTGSRGYAVIVRHPKRPKDNENRPFRKCFVECDRGGRRKPGSNEFRRTTRNWDCPWKGVIYRTAESPAGI